MKKIVYACDRCKEVISEEGGRFNLARFTEEELIPEQITEMHFCKRCVSEVIKILLLPKEKVPEEMKPPDEDEEGDFEGKVEVPEPWGERKNRRRRPDKGKINALRRAGWDLKKIAEEVGMSEREVSSLINK